MPGADDLAELRHVVEEDQDLELLGEARLRGGVQPGHVDEEELLGKREVLVEEPVPEEGPGAVRQESLVRGEAHRPDAVRTQADRRAGPPGARAELHLADVVAEQLV